MGESLTGCEWVGVVFAGGMAEVPHIDAQTILVNDLHRGIINLATCIRQDHLRRPLLRRLRGTIFHPDELAEAQGIYSFDASSEIAKAWAFFVIAWMSRSGKAGTESEANGSIATRWSATGGDSAVRFQSAIRSIAEWGRVFRRCTFETMDALEFLLRCEDKKGHGIYCDPPFPGAGRRYKHNAGKTDAEERKWHTRLRDGVQRFEQTRVVMRFYDHPLIRELYDPSRWDWKFLDGGKTQANETAPEVLLINRTEAK